MAHFIIIEVMKVYIMVLWGILGLNYFICRIFIDVIYEIQNWFALPVTKTQFYQALISKREPSILYV